MSDWARIEQVIKWAGKNTNSFAKQIGLNRTENLYQIKRGRNGISKNLVESIVSIYPELNRSWILIGEGNMFITENEIKTTSEFGGEIKSGIPYYEGDNRFVLSALEELTPTYHIALPTHKDCTLALRINTTDMDPKIPIGSILLLKRIESKSILFGDTYMVVTEERCILRTVRRNKQDANSLILRSASKGTDILIDREEVKAIYLVRGTIINF